MTDYFEWLKKGYIFTGLVATAAEIPKFDDTTNVPTLWNPADSGKVIIPISISVGAAAASTEVIHGLSLNFRKNCGSAVGTGAPYSVFTEVATMPMLLGSNKASIAKWGPATNTATVAGTLLMMLGLGMWLEGTPANSALYADMIFRFESMLALLPGTSISLCSNVASSTTFNSSVIYAELPYLPGDYITA